MSYYNNDVLYRGKIYVYVYMLKYMFMFMCQYIFIHPYALHLKSQCIIVKALRSMRSLKTTCF